MPVLEVAITGDPAFDQVFGLCITFGLLLLPVAAILRLFR